MKKNSIVIKLGIIIMVLFLSILIPFSMLIGHIFYNVYSLYLNENVRALGDRIEVVATEQMKDESDMYDSIQALTNHELVFFDQDGIVQSGNIFEYTVGSKLSEDWLQRLKVDEYFSGERTNKDTNGKFYYVVKPFMKDGSFSGGVIIYSSINELNYNINDANEWIITSIVAAILLALGYTIFLSWRLSRPLIEMEKATRSIAKGNLHTKVQVYSSDELGSLAKSINDLSIELNDYRTNRSEFLANISHELRTPTSYLTGYGSIIKNQQYESDEELQKYAAIIESEANRLAKLIQDLFELSKMEEGSVQLYKQDIDIEDFIESIVEKVNLKIPDESNRISIHLQESLPSLYTDGLRLEQILMNLLENAVHYTENGAIEVYVDRTTKHMRFIVKDKGPGIPEEDLPHIFNRFHRVEKSRARNLGGSGLGLAIVSELTRHLQGEIAVLSTLGEGTMFRVSIPLQTLENPDESIK